MGFGHFVERFWTYSLWSLEFPFVMPRTLIVFLASAASLAIAFSKQRPFQHPLWKRSHWLVLTQLLFFPIVICIAVLYPADRPSALGRVMNPTANNVLSFLCWFSLALAAFWVYKMKGLRWFAISLVTALEIILVGAFLIAGMAISGDWI